MAQVVEITDKKYPELLKKIGSIAPQKLYYKGNFCDEIFENCLAVVGSRRLTSYGRRATEQLITEIAAAGVTIVSGFMFGGDEAAHSAAVKAGGKTIAVMPCGINIIHPEYQAELYNEILETGGLIISEYEGNFLPQTWSFVQRDRIVAGLSKAVLVTEASLNSGSLITAGYAKKFGRKVFSLPGQIFSEVSKGTIKLIKEGAEVVTEARDILSFYKVLRSGVIPGLTRNPGFVKKTLDSRFRGNDNNLGSLEGKIIDWLKREPMEADAIARALCVPAAKLGMTLSLMQLKGIINQESGKYYVD
ncbi:DNA-protecting protein DprA [Candidatus Shapirobacteria bacterium CG10_big_fil_rev_8_21_14_0_10_38_14]|uniref:DNA-protecting protein DprA n=1 Tax=Candidatus Shapirobacteria bacterium CG10_big_fil_rev_8_21_14_0_10_38_14 TaxID=1974483 RepID=A0A2M8L615_9BACT|nr:MAG: DNA-protecting protein DprA [Candidatus Shapirobacteria bacterium CG10_big_fil_rev_8_21_14_0_10_38_14]